MQHGQRHSPVPKQPEPFVPSRAYAIGALLLVLLAAGGWLIFIRPGDDPVAPRARTITVGAMYPLQGTNAKESEDILDGERFAVEYINSLDDLKLPSPALPGGAGLRGATLKLVARDSGDRCHADATFRQLVDRHKAVAVLGAYQSTTTLRAILAADRLKVPLVNESASAPSLTERSRKPRISGCGRSQADPRPSDWFFRVGPSDREAAKQYLSLFAANYTPTARKPRVAILHESDDIYGNGAAQATETLARKQGMTARQFKYHTVLGPNGESPCTRLRTLVSQIAAYRPDVLFVASYPPDSIAAVQTMKEQGDYTPGAAHLRRGISEEVVHLGRDAAEHPVPRVTDREPRRHRLPSLLVAKDRTGQRRRAAHRRGL